MLIFTIFFFLVFSPVVGRKIRFTHREYSVLRPPAEQWPRNGGSEPPCRQKRSTKTSTETTSCRRNTIPLCVTTGNLVPTHLTVGR